MPHPREVIRAATILTSLDVLSALRGGEHDKRALPGSASGEAAAAGRLDGAGPCPGRDGAGSSLWHASARWASRQPVPALNG